MNELSLGGDMDKVGIGTQLSIFIYIWSRCETITELPKVSPEHGFPS